MGICGNSPQRWSFISIKIALTLLTQSLAIPQPVQAQMCCQDARLEATQHLDQAIFGQQAGSNSFHRSSLPPPPGILETSGHICISTSPCKARRNLVSRAARQLALMCFLRFWKLPLRWQTPAVTLATPLIIFVSPQAERNNKTTITKAVMLYFDKYGVPPATGAGMRMVSLYARCGFFTEQALLNS